MDYIKINCRGFIVYSDALIANVYSDGFHVHFLSIVGTPTSIKATAAHLFQGHSCSAVVDNTTKELVGVDLRTFKSRKIGDVVNSILIRETLQNHQMQDRESAVVYGPDMATVIDRAFLVFDAATSVPLKQEWKEWIWEEILHPQEMYSFGSESLKRAFFISWDEETVEEKILEGISSEYLK